ncbi:alpha-galactosidase [Amycolatopsis sp. FDAARGOS 1241]|uniref:alpha-galactosidase n=1 Tax=Amycolatopsis sp. FDAARGOS 1241 TaxID=2778070 RepID=UPI001950BBBB|nr:alpha-galactosidase [Amycolatopsis sp. FDAARGOS 1241]QRP46306.1 alpha-galactosidase [Amycolatopsis sp. FDAARGOS 1241]
MTNRWTLELESTSYTVALEPQRRWLELVAWGPRGVEHGPSPLANRGSVHFITDADAAPVEYAPRGLRPFSAADLGVAGESWWRFAADESTDTQLRLAFVDELTGLRAVQCYRAEPGTDVLCRWVELTNTGTAAISIDRLGSAGVCVPTGERGARLTYLTGQWSQEFTRRSTVLEAGSFRMESRFGVPGHQYVPWLTVQDAAETDGPAYGVSLAWSGSWELDAEIEPSGLTRVRAGRLANPGPVVLEPGASLTTPELALASSVDGLGGLAGVWHAYSRKLAGPRLRNRRPVLYNSWEATGFEVLGSRQLDLARQAADLGVELFVVDDGWFVGRDDDTGGLGDWTPEQSSFEGGFGAFVESVRALGLDFGLWVEPEAISPKSKLYAEHPDWVYRIDGRPATLIRNQLLLDLGKTEVFEYVRGFLDELLTAYPISYLKWDMNRPPTERGRPGEPTADLDAEHVANYHRLLDHLRDTYPGLIVESCAGGGGRTDLATVSRSDVVWPSDNTAALDRLRIQDGFLLMHAPHLMSSWVTDAPGVFDPRPRSLRFRFVLAMAGVLGIGADLSRWSAEQRKEAAELIARYKSLRITIHTGRCRVLSGPTEPTAATQYTLGEQTVVLAWSTGELVGTPLVPGRSSRIRLHGLDAAATYRDEDGQEYSGAHLTHVGLPVEWTAERDADVFVLTRV